MNRKIILILSFLASIYSCDDAGEEKAIETVLEQVERGAVLRTLGFNNGEFEVGNPESLFSINIEEQDIQNGGVFERVDVFVSFIDNTVEGNDISTTPILVESIEPSAFVTGENGLPVGALEYSFQELLDATGLTISQTNCTDQFRLDLTLHLIDGLSFNLSNSAGTIVNTTGFFKSPFSYLINIVEPISNDAYIGTYLYTSIEDGFFGPTYGEEGLVDISVGHSNNVRVFEIQFQTSSGIIPVEVEFSIVCDIAVVTRYQKTLLGCTMDRSDRVLIGPDSPPGIANSNDDTVFELHYLEGFEGFNAFCDIENFPAKIRLSKQ